MKTEQLVTLAKRRIDEKKFLAENKCERLLSSLRRDSEFAVCERDLKLAQVQYVMRDGSEKDDAKAEIARLTDKRRKILERNGISESDLAPRYACPLCGDTGYVDGKACACLKTEIRRIIAENSVVRNREFTFSNSAETDRHNIAVYKKASASVDEGRNILLTGKTGAGKTYLLSACANQAIERGKSVLFVTAQELNAVFLDAHLSDLAAKQAALDGLCDVDVLCVDDLGTEIVYRNVTAEYFFAVVNDRMNKRKQTFFSTNLTLYDIRDRYDERIFSRIADQKSTFVAELTGTDKRLKK